MEYSYILEIALTQAAIAVPLGILAIVYVLRKNKQIDKR